MTELKKVSEMEKQAYNITRMPLDDTEGQRKSAALNMTPRIVESKKGAHAKHKSPEGAYAPPGNIPYEGMKMRRVQNIRTGQKEL